MRFYVYFDDDFEKIKSILLMVSFTIVSSIFIAFKVAQPEARVLFCALNRFIYFLR